MRIFTHHLPGVVLLLGAACESAWADSYPSEQDYLQELPVVLSASRLSQPISETPNAMTVIDRNMIVASGARNIADLFKLVPGMYVGYSDGHTPVVSYRGTTDAFARRMQVLVDGRAIYLPPFGQVDWVELPLDIGDIERIEVIRGPSAASHGSNSVQGVISIFTRPASGIHLAQLSVNRGDAAISDNTVRWGSMGDNWDYRVTLASRADHGFDSAPFINGVANTSPNDNNSTQMINARVNYRPTDSDSLDFQVGYSDTSRTNGLLNPLPKASDLVKASRDQKTYSDFQQLTWLHTFQENNDIQLGYYHIGRNMKDDRYSLPCVACSPAALNLVSPGSYLIADDAVIHRHDLELQHTLNTSVANRIVWGMGVRHDSVDSPNNFRAPLTWKEYRIFAHDEWRVTQSGLLNIGAMVEKNAQGQTRTSPRVAYSHHLSPRHTLRASMSVAYRNPEMIEESGASRFLLGKYLGNQYVFSNFLAAGGLSPERALSREVGYIGQLDEAGSTLDIRAYHDQINDIIWVDPTLVPFSVVTSKSFKPLFTATYTGLEGTLNYKLAARSNLTMNYSHQVVSAVAAGFPTAVPLSTFYGFVANFGKTVPLNSASLLLSHEFPGQIKLGAGFYHQDKVKVLDEGTAQPVTRRLDLRIAKRFDAPHKTGGEIALVMQNALNDHYKDYNQSIVGKRRTYLTAMLEF